MKELQAALDPEEEKEVHDVSESDEGGLEWQVINEKLLLISSAANIRRKEIQSSCKRDLEDCKDNLGVLDLQGLHLTKWIQRLHQGIGGGLMIQGAEHTFSTYSWPAPRNCIAWSEREEKTSLRCRPRSLS